MNGRPVDFGLLADGGSTAALFVAGGILFLLMLLGFLAVTWARRQMHSPPPLAGDLTLERIESLWNQGVLSESEFRVMRQIAIGKAVARREGGEIVEVKNTSPPSPSDTVESPNQERANGQAEESGQPPGDIHE